MSQSQSEHRASRVLAPYLGANDSPFGMMRFNTSHNRILLHQVSDYDWNCLELRNIILIRDIVFIQRNGIQAR